MGGATFADFRFGLGAFSAASTTGSVTLSVAAFFPDALDALGGAAGASFGSSFFGGSLLAFLGADFLAAAFLGAAFAGATAFLAAAFLGVAALGAAFLTAACLTVVFLATVFLAAALAGAAFLAVNFPAGAFLVATFLGAAFLGAAFLEVGFRVVAFPAAALFAGALEVAFFGAAFFLEAVFLDGVSEAEAFFTGAFFLAAPDVAVDFFRAGAFRFGPAPRRTVLFFSSDLSAVTFFLAAALVLTATAFFTAFPLDDFFGEAAFLREPPLVAPLSRVLDPVLFFVVAKNPPVFLGYGSEPAMPGEVCGILVTRSLLYAHRERDRLRRS